MPMPGGGSIRAELVDESGRVISGYDASGCVFSDVEHPELPLLWRARSPRERVGRTACLRFHVRGAWVYSVRVAEMTADAAKR